MNVREIHECESPNVDLSTILEKLHKEGADNPKILETLSYFKEFHPDEFCEIEEKILSALGVFYKIRDPNNLYSFLMSRFGVHHHTKYGSYLTPVQASIRRAVESHQYSSISAPTSAGKSYSIRDFIVEDDGDAVIVVPSRALIAEYINTMRRRFVGNKNVMISQFVDHVFTSRNLRRIFVLTPERSKDLYEFKNRLNIKTFFFDEAQISEEQQRGIIFDVMVRRVMNIFPSSKIIFAHPFIENPDAQFSKHEIDNKNSYAMSYTQGSVGKICVFKHNNGKFYYFSPYLEKGHNIKNCIEFNGSFTDYALSGSHSILVYVSKSSLYRGDFAKEFTEYIDGLPNITSPSALEIIHDIEHLIGANKVEHRSEMISLLKKGVVIHHGSVPLEVRFLVEDFIRKGHSTLCFATSTLAQGINMPFDIVWLDNNRFNGTENERALAFKNLIGRSGRLSEREIFDYGYVYTSAPKLFSKRINNSFKLKNESLIETHVLSDTDDDSNELIDSIKNDTYDDDKNMPLSKVERLSQELVLNYALEFLDIIYRDISDIKSSIGEKENQENRNRARNCLKAIYEASLGRDLYRGENAVFENAIYIFFHMVQGRSFREIVGIRYSYISDRDNKERKYAKFSQAAEKLPNSNLRNMFNIFKEKTPCEDISYDAVIFDTYDYMDQVISFSLSDVFIATFKIYRDHYADYRANSVIELFRYGTNNKEHILLMRYGFPPEVISDVAAYVENIDESGIYFKKDVYKDHNNIMDIIEWYLP